jgi:hypothetical protein
VGDSRAPGPGHRATSRTSSAGRPRSARGPRPRAPTRAPRK